MPIDVSFPVKADGLHDLKTFTVKLPDGSQVTLESATLDDIDRDHEHLLTIKDDKNNALGKPGDSISFDEFGEVNSFPSNPDVSFKAIPR